jgi:filamentous hemagglutinin family protein
MFSRLKPKSLSRAQPLVLIAAITCTSSAQVVLDGKFGSAGPLTGPNYNITAELGSTRGNNLFHSFSRFDLKAGDVATFTGPAQNIRNVLSRVTGGSPSSIDGTIRSEIAGANFYLINPSGVVFGPNAAVNVSGAFAVSSANYLKLEDGAKFVAALDADDSLLSSAPVSAFGFLEGASGQVEVHGSLRSGAGNPLSVIGSTVLVADGARLEASGSQVSLIGVSAPGEVTPAISSTIIGGSAGSVGEVKPGSVVIRGGKLVVDNARIDATSTGGDIDLGLSDSIEVLNGAQLTTGSTGASKGGSIKIETPALLVDGLDGPAPTRIAAETTSDQVTGTGGDIVVRASTVKITRGGEVSVSTSGAGDAGVVDISASLLQVQGTETPQFATQIAANAAGIFGAASGAGGKISLRADTIEVGLAFITASTLGDGNAGTIEIHADSLKVNNALITTYTSGAGAGGDIYIDSGDLTLDGSVSSISSLALGYNAELPAGKGGLIQINAGNLRVLNDAAISASTYGDGAGGNIHIKAESIVLDTGHPQPGIVPGISASSNPALDAVTLNGPPGGDVEIETGSLTMRNGMGISTTTATPGSGGSIRIKATGAVSLDNQSSIQSASERPNPDLPAGPAGTISMEAGGNVLLEHGSSISTSALESSGGDIQVSSGTEVRLTDSRFDAQAGEGGGGNITVNAPDMVYLLDGTFTAHAVGNGGNLTIQNPQFILLNRGHLISKSDSGNGGNISILSDFFFQSEAEIDASAPFGIPGTVSVSAPEVDLHSSLIGLPGNLLDAEAQLRPDCAVRLSGDVSSFIVLGRGGLPIQPGGLVPSGAAVSWDDK